MEAKLQKWGNSDGIRIPRIILKSLNLKTNDRVELFQQEDKIVIKKVNSNRDLFEKKIKEYKGENLSKEFVWDVKGKEIW